MVLLEDEPAGPHVLSIEKIPVGARLRHFALTETGELFTDGRSIFASADYVGLLRLTFDPERHFAPRQPMER